VPDDPAHLLDIPDGFSGCGTGRLRTTICSGPLRSLAVLVSLALPLGCTGLVTGGEADEDGEGDGPGGGGGGGGDEPVEPDPFEPAPAPLELPGAAVTDAAGRIQGLLSATPFTYSVVVENRTTGQILVEASPDRLLKPASNMKLFTTAAALELLGEDHGLAIRVYAAAPISADGTVAGDLHVVLEHDFTLSSRLYDGPRVRLDRLVRALRQRGLARVNGTVRVSGESVYEANSVGYLNLATERAETTSAMSAALSAAGVPVGGVVSSTALQPPAGSIELLDHAPISLVVGSSPLNTASNNEFADLLIRHIGWRIEGQSSASAGGKAILEWLASTGAPTAGTVFRDGSGLSHDNRVSARATAAMFRFMDESPVGAAWLRTLAIAGVRGTIGARMTGADTRGRVFAKTGTLRDTIALSGALENRHDGQRYLFAILLNNVSDAARARRLADDVVGVVARNLRGSGGRLPAPHLRWVHGTGTAGVLDIAWREVPGAEGYIVWLSEDGRVWRREAARYVTTTRFRAGELSAARPTHVRITARAADGLESDPSATYAGTAASGEAELLLVDGNDRWMAQPAPENVLGAHHDFLAGLATSAGGRVVASVHHGEIDSGEIDLGRYPAALWAAGEQSVSQVVFTPAERAAISAYLDAGGALVVSGSEVVWALIDQGDADERAFSEQILGAGYQADDAGTYEVEGEPGSPFADIPALSFLAPDGMDIMFPDALLPAAGSQVVLRYVGGNGGAAAVASTGPRRVIVTGFPIEAVPSSTARAAILDASLATAVR
jgi:serine-type D-Ala-D-Ala carboxypeptidase/endopeptidase (penicillin-binding protein 4)